MNERVCPADLCRERLVMPCYDETMATRDMNSGTLIRPHGSLLMELHECGYSGATLELIAGPRLVLGPGTAAPDLMLVMLADGYIRSIPGRRLRGDWYAVKETSDAR